jgi:hypothetical protein
MGLTQEILDEVCRQKGHHWRETGEVLTSSPPQSIQKCGVCGKRRAKIVWGYYGECEFRDLSVSESAPSQEPGGR